MLRLLTQEMRVGVRENKNAVIAVNGADFSASVTGEAGVAHGMNVAGADLLARSKAWRHQDGPASGHALRNQKFRFLDGQSRRSPG